MSTSFLITGLRSPAALDWVRRLGRAGHRVAAADSLHWPIGRGSRFLSHYEVLPRPREGSLDYAMTVRKAAEDFGAEWIIPNGEEIFFLAKHRDLFNGRARLLAEPLDVLELLHHKGKFARFTHSVEASSLPIRAPESHEFSSRAEFDEFVESQPGGSLDSWVLKAAFSRFAAQVKVRPRREDCCSVDPTRDNPWIAQRFAAGTPLCTYSLAIDGELTAHTAYFPKHSFNGGAGFYFEPVIREDLKAFAVAVVKHLNFTGQIAFDFISGDEGTFVIECNPRATSGLFLLDSRDPLPFLLNHGSGECWPMEFMPKMLVPGMRYFPGRRARREDYRRATDVMYPPDDRIGILARVRQLWELYQRSKELNNGYDLMAAATEDFEWNGGLMK